MAVIRVALPLATDMGAGHAAQLMGTPLARKRLSNVAFPFRIAALLHLSFVLAASAVAVAAQTPASAQASAPVASTTRFDAALSPSDWKEAGLAQLSTDQMTALDAFIQRDIASARQGDVVAFAKSFTERRTPDEWQRAGIDRLTVEQRARLDAVVAAAIATRPAFAYIPRPAAPGTAHEVKTVLKPWEVHGQVSMFVGGGSHGSSFYGGDFDVWATDPSHHVTVGVGAGEIRGKGPLFGYGCGRGPW